VFLLILLASGSLTPLSHIWYLDYEKFVEKLTKRRLIVNVLIFCSCLISEVTRLMQFVAQASHDLVPPDVSMNTCCTWNL
jgi:hypothetical protein